MKSFDNIIVIINGELVCGEFNEGNITIRQRQNPNTVLTNLVGIEEDGRTFILADCQVADWNYHTILYNQLHYFTKGKPVSTGYMYTPYIPLMVNPPTISSITITTVLNSRYKIK